MYLDLEDYRPDTPRVPTVMTLREAILAVAAPPRAGGDRVSRDAGLPLAG